MGALPSKAGEHHGAGDGPLAVRRRTQRHGADGGRRGCGAGPRRPAATEAATGPRSNTWWLDDFTWENMTLIWIYLEKLVVLMHI